MPQASIPYCGAAPHPAELLARWNLDPWLLLALAVVAGAYALGDGRRADRGQLRLFVSGWVMPMPDDDLLALALVRLDEAARHLSIDPDVIEKLKYPRETTKARLMIRMFGQEAGR